jgi:hypothetical protein
MRGALGRAPPTVRLQRVRVTGSATGNRVRLAAAGGGVGGGKTAKAVWNGTKLVAEELTADDTNAPEPEGTGYFLMAALGEAGALLSGRWRSVPHSGVAGGRV